MSKFSTDEQRVFDKYIHVWLSEEIKYSEKGDVFVRFRDPETGKLFEVSVKEKKPIKRNIKND